LNTPSVMVLEVVLASNDYSAKEVVLADQ